MLCPFCILADESFVLKSEQAFAIHDGYPVSPDHRLVIPRQHVTTLFRVTATRSTGFNIGLND